jgi:hypothetical protein
MSAGAAQARPSAVRFGGDDQLELPGVKLRLVLGAVQGPAHLPTVALRRAAA